MRLHVTDHPLIAHKLTVLRDRETPSPVFRQLVEELVTLLAYEATREVRVQDVEIETPVAATIGTELAKPRPIVVPILRAGLGMLEGMTRLLPTAEVGFLGMIRDEVTLEAATAARTGCRTTWPGGSASCWTRCSRPGHPGDGHRVPARARGARRHRHLPARRAGGRTTWPVHVGHRAEVKIVTAAVDEKLNEQGYIVPGLGDAGDRLYGVVD